MPVIPSKLLIIKMFNSSNFSDRLRFLWRTFRNYMVLVVLQNYFVYRVPTIFSAKTLITMYVIKHVGTCNNAICFCMCM